MVNIVKIFAKIFCLQLQDFLMRPYFTMANKNCDFESEVDALSDTVKDVLTTKVKKSCLLGGFFSRSPWLSVVDHLKF